MPHLLLNRMQSTHSTCPSYTIRTGQTLSAEHQDNVRKGTWMLSGQKVPESIARHPLNDHEAIFLPVNSKNGQVLYPPAASGLNIRFNSDSTQN